MSNHSDIAVKFTDENYLTKAEVAKQLHMLTVDSFWDEIVSYRVEHRVVLPFSPVRGSPYYFTSTEAILAKIRLFETRLNQFARRASNLAINQPKDTKNALFFPILKQIAVLEKTNTNDLTIKIFLSGVGADVGENRSPVRLYLDCLNYYLDRSADCPDSSFLGSALTRLLGSDELLEFYRDHDFDARAARLAYVLNPDYPYAPYQQIDSLMEPFYEWLADDTKLPAFAHAILAMFYMEYIKPFSMRNDSMAILLAKDAYAWASEDKSNAIFFAPFELLLRQDYFDCDAYREAKRSGDVTYLIFESLSRFEALLDNANRALDASRIKPIQDDFHQLSPEEEKRAEETLHEPEQMTLHFEEPKPEPAPVAPEIKETTPEPAPIPETKIETPESAVVTPQPEPEMVAPAPKPVPMEQGEEKPTPVPAPMPKVEAIPEPTSPSKEGTVPVLSSIEPSALSSEDELSKSEIKDYVRYLLETNPALNKKQASFFASHCTAGRYYTIQQYKAFAKCVYETARTSMDKLAEEGYYKKMQFKNKFVYTPCGKENKR